MYDSFRRFPFCSKFSSSNLPSSLVMQPATKEESFEFSNRTFAYPTGISLSSITRPVIVCAYAK